MGFAQTKEKPCFAPVPQLDLSEIEVQSYLAQVAVGSDQKAEGIKLTHKPTGIVVIKADFQQANQNKAAALEELKDKLLHRKLV